MHYTRRETGQKAAQIDSRQSETVSCSPRHPTVFRGILECFSRLGEELMFYEQGSNANPCLGNVRSNFYCLAECLLCLRMSSLLAEFDSKIAPFIGVVRLNIHHQLLASLWN